YAMEIAENAWDYQQSKVDELQKQLIDQGQRFNEQSQRIKDLEHKNDGLQNRVDAAKYYMKNIFSGDSEVDQCHWGDLLDILDGKIVRELEQALKVGES
uniref:hypothetical protein n=2 Tax=Acinetobacter TaxID=469 RepID=UPI0032B19A44